LSQQKEEDLHQIGKIKGDLFNQVRELGIIKA